MAQFTKPACSPAQHIELLRNRGLAVPSEEKAYRYLNSIGYYRLSAYFIPYFAEKDKFIEGTSFDDVLSLYIFDRKLRIHAMDALSRIEIAVRTSISNTLSLAHGPHWFMDKEIFSTEKYHTDLIEKVKIGVARAMQYAHTPFCNHYMKNYDDPTLPPSWMVCEILPMGVWSKLYNNIKQAKHKKMLANKFGFKVNEFASYLHTLTTARNCVAHHSRFWNMTLSYKARNLSKNAGHAFDINTPYTKFVTIAVFLKSFTIAPSWPRRFVELCTECPLDIHHHMKIPEDWQSTPLWQ